MQTRKDGSRVEHQLVLACIVYIVQIHLNGCGSNRKKDIKRQFLSRRRGNRQHGPPALNLIVDSAVVDAAKDAAHGQCRSEQQ